MLKMLLERWRQGNRTIAFPDAPPTVPDRLRGLPRIDASKCEDGCRSCADVCPTDAIRVGEGGIDIDLGRCLFCPLCEEACPTGAITWTNEHRLATSARDDLVVGEKELVLARKLRADVLRLFGRSLKLRVVSAGGCGGCEADVNVLSTPVFDIGRFGIQVVASPRHADGLVVTGAVSKNMLSALKDTYEAMPAPKIVIAVGACAISGGPYAGNPEVVGGIEGLFPVDLYVPGCPPHPITILDGLLRMIGRIEKDGERVGAIRRDVHRPEPR